MSQTNLLPHLPPPPEGKHGWPWTMETDTKQYDAHKEYPKISIVTPSYNQAQFIEETIRSVLLQNYPNLEFIIIDGGSNDGTVEVLKKYDKWITYWVSEKDKGQSDALNKGIQRTTGAWVGWQNSDDIYNINAFRSFAQAAERTEQKHIVYFSNVCLIDENSTTTYTKYFTPFSFFEMKYYGWNITNQTCFFSGNTLREVGIETHRQYTMDAALFFKLAHLSNSNFYYSNQVWGFFREHALAKTSTHSMAQDIGVPEWINLRQVYGIKMSSAPWHTQFFWQKQYCKLRKLLYLIAYGSIFNQISQKR